MTPAAWRCVVTGASSGIGRAVAHALAAQGASVWAIARDAARLAELADQGADAGGEVVPVSADLEHDADLDELAGRLADAQELDVLVHAAGALTPGPFESVARADLDGMLRVNLRAPIVLTQMLLPALRRARGQVVFVNSLAVFFPSAENTAYAATRRGLAAVADGLRAQVNPEGVRVLSVYVGRTATPMQAALHEYEGRVFRPELLLQAEDVARVVLDALALPRSAEVTDVRVRPAAKLPPA